MQHGKKANKKKLFAFQACDVLVATVLFCILAY